jgi:hypothetical protein
VQRSCESSTRGGVERRKGFGFGGDGVAAPDARV